jgi:hypothetical protein
MTIILTGGNYNFLSICAPYKMFAHAPLSHSLSPQLALKQYQLALPFKGKVAPAPMISTTESINVTAGNLELSAVPAPSAPT